MQLKTVIITAISPLASITQANLFFPLFGGSTPAPAPAPAGCPTLQFKPLGSFLLGPSFPNPWSSINVPLSVPNCNAPPAPPPAPSCPAGQSCRVPPTPPTFPSAQASANAVCNAAQGGAGLRACLDINAKPVYCCAA